MQIYILIGAGSGFLGGAMAGVAAMSMYHQYKMYWSLLQYHSLGEYHGYNYGGHRGILLGMVYK